ncbi:hypothetical protein Tco_0727240 [Tanacetum coccineum]|uniref:Uncharacterized protein n=1 Tax=Tanacetum coccineum TaxID=301880 RepID=A0ABQ4YHV2_9ASTR
MDVLANSSLHFDLLFLQIFLRNQLRDVPVPMDHFPVPTLTRKVLSFMVKKDKNFSRNVTPLFNSMLVQPTEDEGEVSERSSKYQPIPSPTHPSKDQPKSQPDLSPRPSSYIPILDSNPEGSGGNHGAQAAEIKDLRSDQSAYKKRQNCYQPPTKLGLGCYVLIEKTKEEGMENQRREGVLSKHGERKAHKSSKRCYISYRRKGSADEKEEHKQVLVCNSIVMSSKIKVPKVILSVPTGTKRLYDSFVESTAAEIKDQVSGAKVILHHGSTCLQTPTPTSLVMIEDLFCSSSLSQ